MRVDRLLSILLIITNKGLVTGQELADHFEVSLRTIYRDIDKLGEAGVPIASTGGRGGGYYIMSKYNLDKLFFNDEEIGTLVPLMENLKIAFGKNPQFNNIALKLETIYDKEKISNNKFSINMSHFNMQEDLKEYIYLIGKAIEETRLLQFDYINRRLEVSRRIAEPIQISFNHGEWFLIAYCRNRKDYRKFKLIRVRDLKIIEPFEKRPIEREELDKIFRESYDNKSIKVTLRFKSKIGEHLIEHFSRDTISSLEDGNFMVTEYFPDDEGLVKFILSLGKDCEVLEPEFLREKVKKYVFSIYQQY